MGLNDITGQLKPWMRKSLVNDAETGSLQSVAGRLTTHSILYYNETAPGTTTTLDDAFFVTFGELFLLQARYIPHAALTSNDTNYATVSVWDGTNTYFTKLTTTGQGSWTDNVPVVLGPVPVDQTVADGVTLRFRIQKAGAGVTVPVGVLQLLVAERIA